ncbi:UNVERIFIED_CONTAM: hypothetical protein GTU68_035203 [Idotea baltica]|nr:hypothetical protein [Idotea baltica]
MSGTSLDGVDAVLVEFKDKQTILIESHSHSIPNDLRVTIQDQIHPEWKGSLADIGLLNCQLGIVFAEAANSLLQKSKYKKSAIKAIGNHGQTLWHQPFGKHPFSMQLGNASIISENTGITTVADFRSRDIAANGQGAPLVPAFHQELLSHPDKNRVILNIGGIANITILPATNFNKDVSGYDTGPGNGLIDAWMYQHKQKRYDKNGDWGKSGQIISELLETLLSYEYFSQKPPKSTGKEAFNLNWLKSMLGEKLTKANPKDIQATLTELTAKTIADNINDCDELFICGGGIHNRFLIDRIQHHLPDTFFASTSSVGIDPDWMEAIAFAWLAKQTIEGKTSNLPAVTGAKGRRILGAIYPA